MKKVSPFPGSSEKPAGLARPGRPLKLEARLSISATHLLFYGPAQLMSDLHCARPGNSLARSLARSATARPHHQFRREPIEGGRMLTSLRRAERTGPRATRPSCRAKKRPELSLVGALGEPVALSRRPAS